MIIEKKIISTVVCMPLMPDYTDIHKHTRNHKEICRWLFYQIRFEKMIDTVFNLENNDMKKKKTCSFDIKHFWSYVSNLAAACIPTHLIYLQSWTLSLSSRTFLQLCFSGTCNLILQKQISWSYYLWFFPCLIIV